MSEALGRGEPINEIVQPGYTTSVECEVNDIVKVSDTGTEVTLTVALGERIKCTFTNGAVTEVVPPSITVCKRVDPPDISYWQFSLAGASPGATTLFDSQCHSFGSRQPGTYTLSEATQGGYVTSVLCDNTATGDSSVTFDLTSSEAVTCWFTNRAAPRGGVVEPLTSGPDSNARLAAGSGSSVPYAGLAGGLAAAALVLISGGWYARRRWLR